jgi:hypothetical protein
MYPSELTSKVFVTLRHSPKSCMATQSCWKSNSKVARLYFMLQVGFNPTSALKDQNNAAVRKDVHLADGR